MILDYGNISPDARHALALERIAAVAAAGGTELSLAGMQLEVLPESISGLRGLKSLWLEQNRLRDLAPLAGLGDLEVLDLSWNPGVDLNVLGGLQGLQWLLLRFNQLADLTPLAELERLEKLDLSGNRVRDVRPLVGLKGLETLVLEGNPLPEAVAEAWKGMGVQAFLGWLGAGGIGAG